MWPDLPGSLVVIRKKVVRYLLCQVVKLNQGHFSYLQGTQNPVRNEGTCTEKNIKVKRY